ncbi:MAG: phosphate acyltransferase PlsX [Dehalococcoidales bacterium]|nr:phosphate acyltransferase PlsX [Dehalococcoidales bacterium]
MIRISIDCMGGDNAPGDVVRGAVAGAREYGLGIILVGPQDKIKDELAKYDTAGLEIEIVHTDEFLVEGEQPAYALRNKRSASIALATRLVREGKAQAVFSAGPTGGVIASALMILGMVEGISKPVLGGPFIGFAPKTVVMDVGGNVDVRPDQLLDFAIVGMVYARVLLDIPDPSVGILSVGAEEGKGNDLVKNTFPLFKQSGLNFIGNVEGYDLLSGKVNVVVCDGFVGNVLVKFYEALGHAQARWLENTLRGKLADNEIKELCSSLLKITSASEAAGGGPIWAVNGLAMKAHGKSKWEEIARGLGGTRTLIEKDIVNILKKELLEVRSRLNIPAG